MKVTQGGDDLGGIWYIFTGASMVDILNYLLRQNYLVHERYEIWKIFTKWKWFKPNETWVCLEKIKDNDIDPIPGSINEKWAILGKSLRENILDHEIHNPTHTDFLRSTSAV